MRVSEIAKQTGKTNAEVAAELGLEPSESPQLKVVPDEVGAAYIKANRTPGSPDVPTVEPGKLVRFWCRSESYCLTMDKNPANNAQFKGHVFECKAEDPRYAKLSDPFIRDTRHVYQVVFKPHEDTRMRMEFVEYLRSLIYTGRGTHQYMASFHGREAIRAMLGPALVQTLDPADRQDPKRLSLAVADRISLKVENYPIPAGAV